MPPQPMSEFRIFSALSDGRFSEHARWIAIIIATWSCIEEQLSFIHANLLGRDYRTSAINFWAVQNYHTRVNMITTAFTHFHADSEQAAEWKRLQPEIKKAYRHRNAVAHAIWERDGKTGNLRRRAIVIDVEYIKVEKQYPINNLKKQADFVSRVGGDVSNLAVATLAFYPHRPKDIDNLISIVNLLGRPDG